MQLTRAFKDYVLEKYKEGKDDILEFKPDYYRLGEEGCKGDVYKFQFNKEALKKYSIPRPGNALEEHLLKQATLRVTLSLLEKNMIESLKQDELFVTCLGESKDRIYEIKSKSVDATPSENYHVILASKDEDKVPYYKLKINITEKEFDALKKIDKEKRAMKIDFKLENF